MKSSKRILLLASGLAFALGGGAVHADEPSYPSRPITLVIPFAAGGGSSSLVGRDFAERLGKALGQPVIVEYRAGAGGMAGAAYVLSKPADGYTLLQMPSSKASIKAMNASVQVDPMRDFTTVSLYARIPTVLAVPGSSPIKDFAQLRKYLQENQGKATWGSTGFGAAPHFSGSVLMRAMKVDAIHVAYKGSAPMLLDLLPGRVTFGIDSVVSFQPHIQSGAVRPIAVIGKQRIESLPNVPTLGELGFKEFNEVVYDGWNSIDVHAGTPAPIVQRLQREIAIILGDKAAQDKVLAMEMALFPPQTPDQTAQMVQAISNAVSPIAAQVKE